MGPESGVVGYCPEGTMYIHEWLIRDGERVGTGVPVCRVVVRIELSKHRLLNALAKRGADVAPFFAGEKQYTEAYFDMTTETGGILRTILPVGTLVKSGDVAFRIEHSS